MILLNETFGSSVFDPQLKWHCEPNSWKLDNGHLEIMPDSETDFWQRTHYGFEADNGHFLFAEIEGDFILESKISCQFRHQYDQAGLMVRASETCWVKTSVENELGEPNKLGAVVTNQGYSDWSTQDVGDDFKSYRLRLSRTGSDYKVEYFREKDDAWIQMRLFHLFDRPAVRAGIYCCSPKVGGFTAAFDYLILEGKTSNE